jgi:hypothetical protein
MQTGTLLLTEKQQNAVYRILKVDNADFTITEQVSGNFLLKIKNIKRIDNSIRTIAIIDGIMILKKKISAILDVELISFLAIDDVNNSCAISVDYQQI